ncbi:MAG: hypothetical protein GY856_06130 [bacterium]|nr:hypothetical protein [bacterium]
MREKGSTGAAGDYPRAATGADGEHSSVVIGANGEHSRAVTVATGEHTGIATGADLERGRIWEGGSTRALDLLRRRIQAQGYRLSEVAQAMGWPPGHLNQARDRDLTYADIILICELIGESVAEFSVEVGWLGQEETADLKSVMVPARDYLLALLADCAPSTTPSHPTREGWTALDRREFRAEAQARYHYLAWLLTWLECSEELDRRALQRRQAKERRHPLPRFKAQHWPAPSQAAPGADRLDLLLPADLATRTKAAAERMSTSGRTITGLDVVGKALAAFLQRNERKADRVTARQEARQQFKLTKRRRK